MSVRYQPERVEGSRDPVTQQRIIDKNFDQLASVLNDQGKHLTSLNTTVAVSVGSVTLSGILALIAQTEKEMKEFALMVGGDW
jgi:hypothetical protein